MSKFKVIYIFCAIILLFLSAIAVRFLLNSSINKFSPKEDIKTDHQKTLVTKYSVNAMGTTFDIVLALPSADYLENAEKVIEKAFREIQRIEELATVYKSNSYLSQVNAMAGKKAVRVPGELIHLIELSKEISTKTKGKFDISFGPLGALWNFKIPSSLPPESAAIAKTVPLVDYKAIVVDLENSTVFLKKKKMNISLGGFVPGYAADRVAEILTRNKFKDFTVNAGGEIYFSGKKGNLPWKLGIQHPRNSAQLFAKLDIISPSAVSTSGDYEKYIEIEGKRFHHIIDPNTGYPPNELISVTVFADNALLADALSTGVFLLGAEEGIKLIESDSSLEGILITEQFQPIISSGLVGKIEIMSEKDKWFFLLD